MKNGVSRIRSNFGARSLISMDITFFNNNIQKTNDYKPCYFNGDIFLNDEENPVSEATVNAKEWANYLGGGVKPNDVEKAMYKLKDTVESALYNK